MMIDQETGEILDSEAPTPRGLQRIENNGIAVPKQGRDVSSVIAMLEDGQFNADVAIEMRELVQALGVRAQHDEGQENG